MKRRVALQRIASLAALGSPLGFALSASAASDQPYTTLANPVAPEVSGKIEVIEFFSYGCPHCHDFDPFIERWRKTLPPDVNFVRVALAFNPQWAALARLYYTLDAMGIVEKHHIAIFTALHEEKIRLYEEAPMLEWLGKRGVDMAKFNEAWKSFGVQSRMQRSSQIAAAYKINAVPMVAVGGKYVSSASMVGGYDQLLSLVDKLVAQIRAKAA